MTYYKKLFLVLVVVLFVLSPAISILAQEPDEGRVGLRPDAPPYAIHGSYSVGTQEILIEDGNARSLIGTLWYPASNPEQLEEILTYTHEVWPAPIMGKAILNAMPDSTNAPYPLVIFAHGRQSFRFQSTFLLEHLASYGFVVLAVEYEDNFASFGTDGYYTSLISRPQDVTRQIDFAEDLTQGEGAFAGMIDPTRIAVTGHSFGGWTSLAAAGAQLDLNAFRVWCDDNPQEEAIHACNVVLAHEADLATLAGLDTAPNALWPAQGDARVDAIVSFAPNSGMFGSDGISAVTVPGLFLYGSNDTYAEVFQNQFDYIANDHKNLVIFENADHYIYFNECRDLPGFIEAGLFFGCSDPVWDQARAHDLINHFTTAFLLAELNGDEEAATALTPEAVNMPGISYIPTMHLCCVASFSSGTSLVYMINVTPNL